MHKLLDHGLGHNIPKVNGYGFNFPSYLFLRGFSVLVISLAHLVSCSISVFNLGGIYFCCCPWSEWAMWSIRSRTRSFNSFACFAFDWSCWKNILISKPGPMPTPLEHTLTTSRSLQAAWTAKWKYGIGTAPAMSPRSLIDIFVAEQMDDMMKKRLGLQTLASGPKEYESTKWFSIVQQVCDY